jgi:hypothetical protein
MIKTLASDFGKGKSISVGDETYKTGNKAKISWNNPLVTWSNTKKDAWRGKMLALDWRRAKRKVASCVFFSVLREEFWQLKDSFVIIRRVRASADKIHVPDVAVASAQPLSSHLPHKNLRISYVKSRCIYGDVWGWSFTAQSRIRITHFGREDRIQLTVVILPLTCLKNTSVSSWTYRNFTFFSYSVPSAATLPCASLSTSSLAIQPRR